MVAAPGGMAPAISVHATRRLWHRERATFDASPDTTRARTRAAVAADLRRAPPGGPERDVRAPASACRRRATWRNSSACRGRSSCSPTSSCSRRGSSSAASAPAPTCPSASPPRRPAPAPPPVRPRLSRFGAFAADVRSAVEFPAPRPATPRFDFAYGRSDVDCFPFEHWWRLLHRCARRTAVRGLDYGDAAGIDALREAIAAHLRRSRSVACDAVAGGRRQRFAAGARSGRARAPRARRSRRHRGSALPGDARGAAGGRRPGDRRAGRSRRARSGGAAGAARLLFVTPSHQYPTGAILPLSRRQALLQWAERADAADRRGRLRRRVPLRRPPARVAAGTRSPRPRPLRRHVLADDLLGAADRLRDRAAGAGRGLHRRQVAVRSPHGDARAGDARRVHRQRPLRAAPAAARRRSAVAREALLDALRRHLGNRVEITGDGAGAHVVLWLGNRSEAAVVAAAAARGVGVYGIAPYPRAADTAAAGNHPRLFADVGDATSANSPG